MTDAGARNPDRFVWLRSFPDMQARHKALNDFYYGPLWQANRGAAKSDTRWRDRILPYLKDASICMPETLLLTPTGRSLIP